MRTPSWAGVIAVVALVAAGCGGSEPQPRPSSTPTFEPPDGVTLTRPGSIVDVGDTATVVVALGRARSAVELTVDRIRKGSIDDLESFRLPDEQRSTTPYYVELSVRNRGPAGLGGSTVPAVLRTESGQRIGASEINGELDRCRPSTLSTQFLPGTETELCLVYLRPKGEKVEGIDLQDGTGGEAVHVEP